MKYRQLLAAGIVAAGSLMSLRADITSDLIAHWKFDETAGLTAADSSPRGNTAGLQNFPGDDSQWVSGRVGGALRFNVNDPLHDDFVFTEAPLAFDNTEFYTFAFWVKLELPEKGSNPRFISPMGGNGWVLWMPGKGVHFEGAPGNTPEPQVNVWRHYVIAFNNTSDKASVYVDGVKVLTDITVNKADPGNVLWVIGHSQNPQQHGDHWYGKMDDVRIYNRIFSDADAQELFNSAGAEPVAPPELVLQPGDATRYVGESVTFTASASGSGTLTYQWRKGDQNLDGQTNPTLTLTDLTLASAGDYSLVVTGANGATVTSRTARLTVQEVPPADITSNLIAHWTFDETSGSEAHDVAGGDDTLVLERFTGNPWVPGRVGPGAVRMNVNDLTLHDDGLVTANPVTLDNPNQLSFAFWLKREGDVVPSQPRLIGAPGFWVLWRPNGGVGYEDRLSGAPTPGPVMSTWKHFVVTYNDGGYSVYVDGVKAVDGPVPTSFRVPTNPAKWYVGHPPSDSHFDTWRGDVDDVRIYNRVLTQVDAQALFAAAGEQQPARPTILTQPRTQTKFIGENVTLTASADGTPPLSYRWFKNGTEIPGETGATLTLRDLTVNHSGQYFVRVTNAQGSADSEVATLTVEGSPVVDITSGLVAHWKFDETTGLAGADSTDNGNNVSLANFADETGHWVPGRIGGAVQMNVNVTEFNDLIMTDAPLIFTNKQKFTFSFWLRRDGEIPGNESPRLISPRNTGGWVMYQQTRGVSFEDSQGNGRMNQGVWEHYAVVLDSGIYSVYRNGVKVVDGAGTGLANNLQDVQWVLGHNPDPGSVFDNWRGSMDDVRIYNRTLGAGDVRELYLGTGAFNDVYVASTSPAAGASAVSTGSDIVVTLSDGFNGSAVLNTNSIQMQLNGAPVTPTITRNGDQTIVTYNPPGSLASGSANTVRITYSDMATPPKTQTFEFSFTAANVVEVSGGGAALQQAIAAAPTDTEIVVMDSLDYSEIQLLKRLYIRAAEGQNPRVVYSGTGANNNWAVWVTDSGRQATWDGIDVAQLVPGGGGFLFVVLQHNDDSMFTLKNSDIYINLPGDSADKNVLGLGEKTRVINSRIWRNDNNGNALVRVFDKGSDSSIENTVLGPSINGHAVLNTSAPQSAPMTLRGVTFTGLTNGRGISHHDVPGLYNIDDSDFGPGSEAGTERMFSIFTGDNRANGSVYNISRSTFAPGRSGEGAIFAADGSGVTFNFTNTVFAADAAQPWTIRAFRQSHAYKLVHCTINEREPRAARSFIDLGRNEGEQTGTANSSFNFQNNIINWPGSTDTLVIAARGIAATMRNSVTAGKNLFNTTSHADDALRGVGTEVNADPLLAGDGIHLQAGSPAIDAAVAGFASNDFDAQARPVGAAADLGADEFVSAGPSISIGRDGADLVLTWTGGGTLQQKTDLSQPQWETVTGATSGYRTQATGEARFFRIMQ